MKKSDIEAMVPDEPIRFVIKLHVGETWKEAKSVQVNSYEEFCSVIDMAGEFLRAGEEVVVDAEVEGGTMRIAGAVLRGLVWEGNPGQKDKDTSSS